MSAPFTPEQEARIAEIVRKAWRQFASEAIRTITLKVDASTFLGEDVNAGIREIVRDEIAKIDGVFLDGDQFVLARLSRRELPDEAYD